ncbi:hypothetical protein GCM10029976_033030 [Kribbella albertanoniae]
MRRQRRDIEQILGLHNVFPALTSGEMDDGVDAGDRRIETLPSRQITAHQALPGPPAEDPHRVAGRTKMFDRGPAKGAGAASHEDG